MFWWKWPRNLPPGVLLVLKIPVTHTYTQQLNIKYKNNVYISTNTLHRYSASMIITAYNNTALIILSQQIQTQNFLCLNRINVLTCIRNSKLLGIPYQLKRSPKPQASQPQKNYTVMIATPLLSHVTFINTKQKAIQNARNNNIICFSVVVSVH